MKSLSPNAQEFIPVTVPITLNHLNHQTFSNQTNQSPIYVPVPSLPSNVHHHHHSPQPSLNQIQFQQIMHNYSVSYFQQQPTNHFNPQQGLFYDYNIIQPPPPPVSVTAYQPKLPTNYTNRPKFNQFNNKNKNISNPQTHGRSSQILNLDNTKPVAISMTENDWPSLNASFSDKPERTTLSRSFSDNEEEKHTQIDIPIVEPTRLNETTVKKIMKNVNFIKKTVEQHYLSQTLSFKDAVLKKPEETKVSKLNEVAESVEVSETNVETAPELVVGKSKKRSERRKRSRNKHKALLEQNDQKEKDKEKLTDVDFDLNAVDFPGLEESNQSNHNKNKVVTEVMKTDIKENVRTSGENEGKKINRPIIVEFANMISALEKGQKQQQLQSTRGLKKQSQLSKPSGLNDGGLADSKLKRLKSHMTEQMSGINQLDSCPVMTTRGKEREKPKQKKHSTLKKIILKERAEKRQLNKSSQQEQNYKNHLSDSIQSDQPQPDSQEFKSENDSETAANTSVETTATTTSDEDTNSTEDEKTSTETSAATSDSSDQEDQENEDLDKTDGDGKKSPISQGSPISTGLHTPTVNTLNQLTNNKTLISLERLEEKVKQKVHNRKFREYCNQIVNKEVDEVCSLLLHEIVRFQDRMYHKNPIKAKARRRYVMGIREVTKHLKLKKLKCVILAPNCEKIQSKGGLDEAINTIIEGAMEQNVPFLFALGRKALGKAVNKLVPISVVGIFDYAGADDYFRRLVGLSNNAKLAYQEMIEEFEREECETLIGEVKITDDIKMVGHSRNSSFGGSVSGQQTSGFLGLRHGHSRSSSGNFNFGHTNPGVHMGHSRSASSGGNLPIFNPLEFSQISMAGINTKAWTHSRTPSNCSNISFISRMSEPISEVGSCGTLLVQGVASSSQYNLVPYFVSSNNNPGLVLASPLSGQVNNVNPGNGLNNAVQFYSEQVRQEMKDKIPEEL